MGFRSMKPFSRDCILPLVSFMALSWLSVGSIILEDSSINGYCFILLYLLGVLSVFERGVLFVLGSCFHSDRLKDPTLFRYSMVFTKSTAASIFYLAYFCLISRSYLLAMGYNLIILAFIFFDFSYLSSNFFLLY